MLLNVNGISGIVETISVTPTVYTNIGVIKTVEEAKTYTVSIAK